MVLLSTLTTTTTTTSARKINDDDDEDNNSKVENIFCTLQDDKIERMKFEKDEVK